MEKWRDISEFPGYQVSNKGRVRSRHIRGHLKFSDSWRMRRQSRDRRGYPMVGLCLGGDGKVRSRRVHRLVLEAFVGPRPYKHETCHRNGKKQDNRLENLYWGTKQDNEADKKRLGEHNPVRGEQHGCSKLISSEVLEIRKLAKEGLPRKTIARIFGISQSHTNSIIRRKSWKHIGG